MDCSRCAEKHCMHLAECRAEKTDRDQVRLRYHEPASQGVVQAAARLVDGGRAGQLNRVEEIIAFARDLGYRKLGLAYCYAFEAEAAMLRDILKAAGFAPICVRCTTGGQAQSDINADSAIGAVSCNPVAQARQLDAEGAELVIVLGLCLGHDILFSRELKADRTTLVVKDRTNGHRPLEAIRTMAGAVGG